MERFAARAVRYDKSGHKARSFVGETDMAALEAAIHKLL
jgi:hypothetical protein